MERLSELLEVICDHPKLGTEIQLCFVALDPHHWTKTLAQKLQTVCNMVSDPGATNVTILIDSIFVAHEDLEIYEDSRSGEGLPLYKVKVYGPEVKIKFDQLQYLVDPQYTRSDYADDDCDYD